MSLLFMDSFDHYATADLLEKWSALDGAPTIVAAAGRRGTAALRLSGSNASAQRTVVASGATAIVGMAINAATLPGSACSICHIGHSAEGSVSHVEIAVLSTGLLTARQGSLFASTGGGTLLGTSSAGLSAGTFAFLEVLITIGNAPAGRVEIRLNGSPVLSVTGVDTQQGTSTGWNILQLGESATSVTFNIDDLYLLDGSGPAPLNDFLGDCRVDPRVPTAPGAVTGWTPSTAPNWSCVDDAAPNDDTDYVSAAAPATDTYALQDAPVVGGQIYGVQLLWNIKKLDAGTCSVAPVIRQGTTNLAGTAQNPGTAYGYQSQVYGTNPHTSAAWTESDFNADEFGLERTA